MYVLGIDPGRSGGFGLFPPGVDPIAWSMPKTPLDLWALFGEIKELTQGGQLMAMLEFVHSMPRDGSKQAYTFGRWVGYLEMALTGHGIPFDTVKPQTWMGALNCMTKGDKSVTKKKAQELFPSAKVTRATADALLIGVYAKDVFSRRAK